MSSSTQSSDHYETSAHHEGSDHHQRFGGDRYERLSQGVDVLATDPAVSEAPYPYNAVGLRALITAIAAHRLLDHLSDANANMVTAWVLLDFHGGIRGLTARIHHLLRVPGGRPDYDTLAVVSGLASLLALMVDGDAWLPASTRERN